MKFKDYIKANKDIIAKESSKKVNSVLMVSTTQDVIRLYNSVKDAASELGVAECAIRSAISGKTNTSCKHLWLYLKDAHKYDIDKWATKGHKTVSMKFGYKVVATNIYTNEKIEYSSVNQAARRLRVHPNHIYTCMNRNGLTAYGYYWSRVVDGVQIKSEEVSSHVKISC